MSAEVLPVPQIELLPASSRPHPHPMMTGVQHLYQFPNGRGASVVMGFDGPFGDTYGAAEGQWELAPILRWTGGSVEEDWTRDCDLGIEWGWGDEVIGFLTDADLAALLVRIAALPPAGGFPC